MNTKQDIERILYKFDIYKDWFTKENLESMKYWEVCDLIGFCLDVKESLTSIALAREE